MAAHKKSFKDNPALAFITPPKEDTDNTEYTHDAEQAQTRQQLERGGKRETKSKRLNLILQPSVMDALTKIAYMNRASVNATINAVLKQYVDDNAAAIDQYNTLFKEEQQ